ATSGPSVEERAIKYLAKVPPAIDGQGGHNQTMEAARAICWGFAVGSEAGFNLLWEHYNPRCQPPWTEQELRHKCQDADTKPFGKPHGYLLNEEKPASEWKPPDKHRSNGNTESFSTAPPEPPPWPEPPAQEAFHGLAGRIVEVISPASEADPSALLVQSLVA